MAQLVVRNLEDDVKERLRKRAKARGHSMEEEARDILRSVLAEKKAGTGTGKDLIELLKSFKLESPIPEWKGDFAHPAKFKK